MDLLRSQQSVPCAKEMTKLKIAKYLLTKQRVCTDVNNVVIKATFYVMLQFKLLFQDISYAPNAMCMVTGISWKDY